MESIEETNRLIAEFMGSVVTHAKLNKHTGYGIFKLQGWTPNGIVVEKSYTASRNNMLNDYIKKYCKFHTSWDWLMPVVEKVEGLGYNVLIKGNSCTIYNRVYNVERVIGKTKIQAVYNHIIQFIQWYNSNPIKP